MKNLSKMDFPRSGKYPAVSSIVGCSRRFAGCPRSTGWAPRASTPLMWLLVLTSWHLSKCGNLCAEAILLRWTCRSAEQDSSLRIANHLVQYLLPVVSTEWVMCIPGKAKFDTCWYPYGGHEHLTNNFSWVTTERNDCRLVKNDGRFVPGASALRSVSQFSSRLMCACSFLSCSPGNEKQGKSFYLWGTTTTHVVAFFHAYFRIGFQNDGAGYHYAVIAETPHGRVPGKAKDYTCWYPYDGREHITHDFCWVRKVHTHTHTHSRIWGMREVKPSELRVALYHREADRFTLRPPNICKTITIFKQKCTTGTFLLLLAWNSMDLQKRHVRFLHVKEFINL